MKIYIINPLGAALAHYSYELQSVLDAAGVQSNIVSQIEPSLSQDSRLRWIISHFANVWRLSRECHNGEFVLCTWPVLGYFDIALNWLLGGSHTWLVIHDPRPLVRSIGHGPLGRLVLRCFKSNRLICHSMTAYQTISDQGRNRTATFLPHPIADVSQRRMNFPSSGRILVIGQYKADRDLELIQYIGDQLYGEVDLRIVGRGWPWVRSWNVEDRFLSEQEFCDEIASASIVLIPYRRFFQSGVAVRCLEMGIPFVGPKGSSLDELICLDSAMVQEIENKNAWVRTIRMMLTTETSEMMLMADRYMKKCNSDWSKWLATAQDMPVVYDSDSI